MATDYTKFRLLPGTIETLADLAASAGNLSAAVRECIYYWHRVVAEAGRQNADELTPEEWERLGHTGDPSPMILDDDNWTADWSARLAIELVGMYEGKPVVLPEHKAGLKAATKLANKIADWGVVRGYAMMSAIRYLWTHESVGKKWWEPEVWMAADEKPNTEAAS
jgi:hypothetical protein